MAVYCDTYWKECGPPPKLPIIWLAPRSFSAAAPTFDLVSSLSVPPIMLLSSIVHLEADFRQNTRRADDQSPEVKIRLAFFCFNFLGTYDLRSSLKCTKYLLIWSAKSWETRHLKGENANLNYVSGFCWWRIGLRFRGCVNLRCGDLL